VWQFGMPAHGIRIFQWYLSLIRPVSDGSLIIKLGFYPQMALLLVGQPSGIKKLNILCSYDGV